VDYQDVEPGAAMEFAEVLYLGGDTPARGAGPGDAGLTRVGNPPVKGAKVLGTVVGVKKGPKLIVAYFRRRKNSRKRVGHRQKFVKVRIDSIQAYGRGGKQERQRSMAHKKGQGATQKGRDSNPQFRGLKVYGGGSVKPGQIIVRQCGTKFRPGFGVGMGSDYTIFAVIG